MDAFSWRLGEMVVYVVYIVCKRLVQPSHLGPLNSNANDGSGTIGRATGSVILRAATYLMVATAVS